MGYGVCIHEGEVRRGGGGGGGGGGKGQERERERERESLPFKSLCMMPFSCRYTIP